MESSKHCLQVYAFISNVYINSPPDFLHVLIISGHITSPLFFSQDDYFYFLIDGHSCNCSLFSLHFHSTLYHTFLSLIAFHAFWLAQKKGLYGKTVQKWNLFFWWQHSETHSSSKHRLSLAAWGVPHGLIHLNEGNASMYHSSCSPKGTGLLSVESRVWEVVSAHKFLTGHVRSIGYLKH